ncbi:MAG: TonB-dependent receptor [Bacteroidia bacterium]
MMIRFLRHIFILLAVVGSSALQAQFTLKGKVLSNEGKAIEGVTVFLHEANLSRITDKTGTFEFSVIKPGNYHLHLNRIGYAARQIDIKLQENLEMEFVIQKTYLELRQAIVEESMFKSGQSESSQSVNMVDRDQLLKNGDFSLVKMLESVPGVSSINTGTGISKPVIRGMSFNRVVVAENGIKQEGQQWGGDHGLEIDQFAIDRVEVIRGPASLLYGSDGLGGVVNIRPAPFPKKNTVSGSVLASGRSVNDFIGSSVMTAVNKNDIFFRARISTQDYGDYRVPADSFTYNTYILPIVNGRLKNTAGSERNAQFMTGINRQWGFTTITASIYQLHAGLFSGAHGIPRSYQLIDDGDNRNIDLPKQGVEHYKILSNSAILLGKNWLEADFGYQYNHRREFSSPHAHGKGPQPVGNKELEFMLSTLSANIRYHQENSTKSQWVLGLQSQIQNNTIGGFQFLIPRFNTYSLGVFAFNKFKVNDNFLLNGGIRYDLGNIQTDRYMAAVYADSVTIIGFTQRSPELNREFHNFSASTGFSWLPANHWNIKFNLAKSFRMPTAQELTSNGVHHGSFRHEMGDSTLNSEHGYQSDFSISFENGHRLIRLTPYFNYFQNYIFLDPKPIFSPLHDAGLIYQFNQANAIHTGLELQTDFHLTEAFHAGLTGQFVYAYNLATSYPLPFIPPGQLKLDLGYEWEELSPTVEEVSVGAQIQAVADQYEVARNELPTNGFALLNLNSSVKLKAGKQEVRLVLNIQNVFNTKYFGHLNRYRILNLPEPGRNVLLTVFIPFESKIKQ